jgi:hypothetical protein
MDLADEDEAIYRAKKKEDDAINHDMFMVLHGA